MRNLIHDGLTIHRSPELFCIPRMISVPKSRYSRIEASALFANASLEILLNAKINRPELQIELYDATTKDSPTYGLTFSIKNIEEARVGELIRSSSNFISLNYVHFRMSTYFQHLKEITSRRYGAF